MLGVGIAIGFGIETGR